MSIIRPPDARLILMDTGAQQSASLLVPREIVFQYEPQGVTETASSSYASSNGMNRDNPIVQFSNGDGVFIRFNARFWAVDSTQSVEQRITDLKNAVRRDSDLNRPPRWQFVWGKLFDELVVVQSVGDISYDRMRPDGSVHGATCPITLQKVVPIDIDLVAQDRETDTFFIAVREGEQWEDMAVRQYGDALMGELLRRRNPGLPFPGSFPGRIVKLPKPETLRNEPIEPTSPPLQRTAAGLALRARVVEARSVPRETAVLKK